MVRRERQRSWRVDVQRHRREHRNAGKAFDLARRADARIEADQAEQQNRRQENARADAGEAEMHEAQSRRTQRQFRRFLDDEGQAAMIGVEVHRDARVFAALEQILIDVAIHFVIAREFGQLVFRIGDAAAAVEFGIQQRFARAHARLFGGDVAAHFGELAAQFLIQRIELHRIVDRRRRAAGGALRALGLFAADLILQVLHLMTHADHVGMLVGVGEQQPVELRLQFGQARAVLAFARLHGGDFGFAGQLRDQRGFLRALFHQVHARVFDLRAQFADARARILFAARTRVGILAAIGLELVFGVGELVAVDFDLAVDEFVRVAALALFRGEAFGDEQVGEPARHVVGAFGIRILVGDLQQVLAQIDDADAALDAVDDALELERTRVGILPAAGFDDFFEDLAAEDHLARDGGAVGVAGGRRRGLPSAV